MNTIDELVESMESIGLVRLPDQSPTQRNEVEWFVSNPGIFNGGSYLDYQDEMYVTVNLRRRIPQELIEIYPEGAFDIWYGAYTVGEKPRVKLYHGIYNTKVEPLNGEDGKQILNILRV